MAHKVNNGLSVSLVESLDEIVPSVVDYLTESSADRDIFEVDHIIVPNAGVRAWLLQKIASHVGVSSLGGDGVAANLNIGYLGALDSLIGRSSIDDDPWSVSALTMSVLAVVSISDSQYDNQVERLGGGLRAARAIADQFDRYNARRPSMVVEWEKGHATLAPALGDALEDNDHMINTPELEQNDMWQFVLWRKVRDHIGVAPWPVLIKDVATRIENGQVPDGLPSRFLVVGLQSLSVRHIEVLRALSLAIEVRVVLVHPSLSLAHAWAAQAETIPVSLGIAPTRNPNERIDPTIDQLVGAWLRGARETQLLLASQDVTVHIPEVPARSEPSHLLAAVQHAISTGVARSMPFDEFDMSIRMHRTHNLARQVEILRDALLHAFHDIEGLEPHDVVIMCADIEAAAPLIEATFARKFTDADRVIQMPVVVADRSLRHVDDGAQLLHDLVSIVSSRFALSDVLGIAASPLVLREFSLGADDVAVWERVVDGADVRWGASPAHRARKGVEVPGVSAHTWSLAIERALLGAILPDSLPAPEIGNVVPLRDIDASEIDSVTALSCIVSVLVNLEKDTSSSDNHPNLRTITEWSLMIETALSQLSNPADGEIDSALQVIDQIRQFVRLSNDTIPVRFEHFAAQLLELISETPGRQPLRTGAITATSMVPLRGVPFKVVCLVGFDEGSLTTGEVEGDDLIERQRFVGDSDPRIDQRRAFLDALCAASHRVVITSNGRSIKDNKEVPLITPFAELLDLCERCGVANKHGHTLIEHQHPRHFSSIRNFLKGEILPGIVWSHDPTARQSVARQGMSAPVARLVAPPANPMPSGGSLTSIKHFHTLATDPLRLFINTHLAINTWKESVEEESATIPLETNKNDLNDLCVELLAARLAGFDNQQWETVQDSAGMLPIGKYKTATVDLVVSRVNSLLEIAAKWNINLGAPEIFDIDIATKYGSISGSIVMYRTPEGYVAMHPFSGTSTKKLSTDEVALNLLILAASGHFFNGTINIGVHDKVKNKCQAWFVELGPDIDQSDAIDRLEHLIELIARAESMPLPMFGDAAFNLDDDNAARKAFATRIKSDFYPTSNECLVYGPGPDFDAVYPPQGAERSFFAELIHALPVRDEALEKALKFVKPPDKSRAQQRYVYV